MTSFVDDPHTAIEDPGQGEIVNLTDHRAEADRHTQLELLGSLGSDGIVRELSKLEARDTHFLYTEATNRTTPASPGSSYASRGSRQRRDSAPAPREFSCGRRSWLNRLPRPVAHSQRGSAYRARVGDGRRGRARSSYRFTDSARFSFAHGGKDRHPFPVPLRVYDETIRLLKSTVSKARLGREEELGAMKRLDEQARLLEHRASGPHVEELIVQEREQSHLYGGGSVFGWAQPSAAQSMACNESEQTQSDVPRNDRRAGGDRRQGAISSLLDR